MTRRHNTEYPQNSDPEAFKPQGLNFEAPDTETPDTDAHNSEAPHHQSHDNEDSSGRDYTVSLNLWRDNPYANYKRQVGCIFGILMFIVILVVAIFFAFQGSFEVEHENINYQITQHSHYTDNCEDEILALSQIKLSWIKSYRNEEDRSIADAVCNLLMTKYRRDIQADDFVSIHSFTDKIEANYRNEPNILAGVKKFETVGREKVEKEYIDQSLWKMRNIESYCRNRSELWPWVPHTINNILYLDPTNPRALEIKHFFGI